MRVKLRPLLDKVRVITGRPCCLREKSSKYEIIQEDAKIFCERYKYITK